LKSIEKMSTSPPNYDFEGDPLLEAYMNAKFSEEISEKMKVPKRSKLHIKFICILLLGRNNQNLSFNVFFINYIYSFHYY